MRMRGDRRQDRTNRRRCHFWASRITAGRLERERLRSSGSPWQSAYAPSYWRSRRSSKGTCTARWPKWARGCDQWFGGGSTIMRYLETVLVWAGSETRWAVSGLAFCEGAVRSFAAEVGNTWHG